MKTRTGIRRDQNLNIQIGTSVQRGDETRLASHPEGGGTRSPEDALDQVHITLTRTRRVDIGQRNRHRGPSPYE